MEWLIRAMQMKEAIASSRMEGVVITEEQASLMIMKAIAPSLSDEECAHIVEHQRMVSEEKNQAMLWLAGSGVGVSSKTIWCTMMGQPCDHPDVPYDQADLHRCYMLMARIPSWMDRMGEVAAKYPEWKKFVAHWGELMLGMALACPPPKDAGIQKTFKVKVSRLMGECLDHALMVRQQRQKDTDQ